MIIYPGASFGQEIEPKVLYARIGMHPAGIFITHIPQITRISVGLILSIWIAEITQSTDTIMPGQLPGCCVAKHIELNSLCQNVGERFVERSWLITVHEVRFELCYAVRQLMAHD